MLRTFVPVASTDGMCFNGDHASTAPRSLIRFTVAIFVRRSGEESKKKTKTKIYEEAAREGGSVTKFFEPVQRLYRLAGIVPFPPPSAPAALALLSNSSFAL
jgi:hypothetical protein